MNDNRLNQIMDFCRLLDEEKFIRRRTYLSDGERLENDAEHAWHLAMMSLLLSDYSNGDIDRFRVMSMVLVHDLVEIYAGDTFAYDEQAKKTQRQREVAAADRLFSQLPEDMASRIRGLWDEFEAWDTSEARFAHTLDNIQPLMLQHASNGRAWREGNRKVSEVLHRNERTKEGSTTIWDYAMEHYIEPEIEAGNLKDDR